MEALLSERVEILVRFNEADPLGIVWHGHYVRYFEDGREAFGNKFGLRYLDIFANGYTVPVVHVDCNYKRSLRYGDSVIVETRYVPTPAAKIRFEYTLYNATTHEIVATGASVQVFLDKSTQTLQLILPKFFEQWKQQHALS
ncbi:acyl-CoA thioester hydrolase [Chitinophaga costaii]|uniref:Acyl-CoA thioester hydrolase n=1 Tax=Chitinophaga costaii TaxID=1335309 RepID=A0A1C3ZHM5_9BACT|nr:acyl-CoA thioesterase [Chitinophaga costaii]PUZ30376.1 acyl-CoA thioesterase [Chitinophaga costaii]SCB81865.1 acyl-CoA thioester hydrolase [Chitinophaga costaii]